MKLPPCTQSTIASAEMAHKKEKGVPIEREPTKCVCRTNCIVRPLRGYFERHGRYVAKHPYPFFIIPLILTCCMSYGLRHLHINEDVERMVTPKNGQSKEERKVVQEYFHVDQNGGYMPERSPNLDGFLDIIFVSQDGGSMLTEENIARVVAMEQFILNVTTTDDDGNEYGFADICANWKGECMDHPILMAYHRDPTAVNTTHLTYPKYGYLFMGHALGNVTVDPETSYVTYARATRLTYFVRYGSLAEQEMANRWFIYAEKLLQQYEDPRLIIYHGATNSLEVQFIQASESIMPKFAAPFVLLVAFSVLSCMMNDWVSSKPYLAFTGLLSTGLSLATTFGFLSAIGVSAVPHVGLVPFLTIGVGVDNMFILISAWRRTDVEGLLGLDMHKRVQIRMGEAMKDAAQSITITSLTDILAFGIGGLTEFYSVEVLALYTGLSIFFAYVYCITFFAAAMVFSGWREEANRHCFSLKKVLSKKEAREYGWWYRVWCASGKPGRFEQDSDARATLGGFIPSSSIEENLEDGERDHLIMKFFNNIFGPILMKPVTKAVVLIMYGLYIAGAAYGCWHIRRGVSFEKLSNLDSYLSKYYTYKDTYYNHYSLSVGIVISETLDYSDPKIQNDVDRIIETFTNDTAFFCGDNTISWLNDYLGYLDYSPRKPKSSQEFIDMLWYQFLTLPGADRHRLDVSFNPEVTQIEAARFYVQSLWYKKTEEIMLAARRVAETITDYNVTVFHQTFIYFDQPVVVWQNTIQNIILAILCMLFVSMMFVPTPLSAVWVTLATASIECGVMGYMTLWDVNVDVVSMTYLILCIGFSVDFSVHITYGFIASEAESGNDKAIEALHVLGYPILQSGISTILAVIFLCMSITYFFISFYKTMVLVIVFGVWHALFVLPVVLSLLSGHCKPCTAQNNCQCECTKEDITVQGQHICQLVSECDKCSSETSLPENADGDVITEVCTNV